MMYHQLGRLQKLLLPKSPLMFLPEPLLLLDLPQPDALRELPPQLDLPQPDALRELPPQLDLPQPDALRELPPQHSRKVRRCGMIVG